MNKVVISGLDVLRGMQNKPVVLQIPNQEACIYVIPFTVGQQFSIRSKALTLERLFEEKRAEAGKIENVHIKAEQMLRIAQEEVETYAKTVAEWLIEHAVAKDGSACFVGNTVEELTPQLSQEMVQGMYTAFVEYRPLSSKEVASAEASFPQ